MKVVFFKYTRKERLMNGINANKADQNGRIRIDDIFPMQKIILFTFFTMLSCIYIPCAVLSLLSSFNPIYLDLIAFLVVGCGVTFLFFAVKRLGIAISSCIVLFFFYSYTESPIIPALIAAVVLSLALGGFLTSICPKKYSALTLLLIPTTYFGALGLTGDATVSLVAIAVSAAAITLGFLQRKNTERKSIILYSSAVFILVVTGMTALLLSSFGLLSEKGISDLILSARDSLSEYMKSLSIDMHGEAVPAFEAEYIDLYLSQVFNLIPAIFTVSVFVIIYFAHSLQLSVYKSCDFDIMVTQKTVKINMSIYAAIIFVASYILSLSTDTAGHPDMLGTVCSNLNLILTPGLFLVGFDGLRAILIKLRALGFILLLLLCAAVFLLSSYIILIMSAIGAFYIIILAIDEWAKKHYLRKKF